MLRDEETSWGDIFAIWKEREGTMEGWKKVAKQKGWESWEEWRDAHMQNIGAKERKWFRYEILDPLKSVPQFKVGPTPSWQAHFPESERNQHTFEDLVNGDSFHGDDKKNDKTRSMLVTFPKSTEFIGVVLADKTVVLMEGHHRAAAIALAAQKGEKVKMSGLPTIAIAFFDAGEETLIDAMLRRGSAKLK